jgi:hypothetical protein
MVDLPNLILIFSPGRACDEQATGIVTATDSAQELRKDRIDYRKGGAAMAAEATTLKTRTNMVWVRDRAGNEYVCELKALKNPKELSEEEKKHCIEDASVHQPSAGG